MPDPGERFWSRVAVTPSCWLWTGSEWAGGYGRFIVGKKPHLPHRWAYERLVGPIEEGLTLDHLCRVQLCVRPDHLEPVTQRENTLRGTSPAAENAKKTHCKRDHPLSGENLYINPRGERQCRVCSNARSAAYQQRRAAAA